MLKIMKNGIVFVLLIVLFCSDSVASFADAYRDVKAISRSVGFVVSGPIGDVSMDILYDPKNPDSLAHANEIFDAISNDTSEGKVNFIGRKITSPSDSTSKVIFLTRGTQGMYDYALEKAAENAGITVSNDKNCLGVGCVLVVKTDLYVDIAISTELAKQLGVKFSSAFRMIVTKR